MSPSLIRTIVTAMGSIRIGIGATALLAPGRSSRMLGFPPEQDTAGARVMGRLFGVRDVALGAMVLDARDNPGELRRLCALNAAVDAGDAASFAVPIVRRQGIDQAAVAMASVALPAAASWLLLRRALG
jgi:hypothetical protein